VCEDEQGGYSVHATRLPGVVSQGESIEEALDNIRDAFQAAVQVYLEGGQAIPWQTVKIERPAKCFERWILVDV
jgi:predicted RNase H-like HicB family nuclease